MVKVMGEIYQPINRLLEEMKQYDYLHKNTIYLDDEVSRDTQVMFCRQLRKLAEQELVKSEKERQHIKIRISSFGGWVVSFMAMASEMLHYQEKGVIIETYCDGFCMSAGAYLLMLGSKGYRFATRFSDILIHQTQFSGGGHQTYREKEKSFEYDKRDWKMLCDLMREHTKLTDEDIEGLTKYNLDVSFSSTEALEKGIIDQII
jgi:ATP-dependent Clp protease protease subunit